MCTRLRWRDDLTIVKGIRHVLPFVDDTDDYKFGIRIPVEYPMMPGYDFTVH